MPDQVKNPRVMSLIRDALSEPNNNSLEAVFRNRRYCSTANAPKNWSAKNISRKAFYTASLGLLELIRIFVHPTFYAMGTGCSLPGVKWPIREAVHAPQPSAKVKNECNFTFTACRATIFNGSGGSNLHNLNLNNHFSPRGAMWLASCHLTHGSQCHYTETYINHLLTRFPLQQTLRHIHCEIFMEAS